MKFSRMELADAGSPQSLVSGILKQMPDLPIPVPIEEIALGLDIIEVRALEADGYEGGLLTQRAKTTGIILVKQGVSRQRRRFTIGHELGHFLMPLHMPSSQGAFLCSRQDLSLLAAKEQNIRSRMEVEANTFSSLLLMPPPVLRKMLARSADPDLRQLLQLAREFDVSKEAMMRAYLQYRPESLAGIIVRDGAIQRIYKGRQFPFVTAVKGAKVPRMSAYYAWADRNDPISGVLECIPDLWIDTARGKRAPSMFEQVCRLANGFAFILLWYEGDSEEDDEYEIRFEDKTAKQRWRQQRESRDRW